MAFTIPNKKKIVATFNINQTAPGIIVKGTILNGGSHPPRNKIVIIAHIKKVAASSPKK
jgi:hypothetical protein